MARRTARVTLYMRVEGQRELCVGSAASMADVPTLLRDLAARWQAAHDDDVLLYSRVREPEHSP